MDGEYEQFEGLVADVGVKKVWRINGLEIGGHYILDGAAEGSFDELEGQGCTVEEGGTLSGHRFKASVGY